MDIVTIAKLCSLLRATTVDYTALLEKVGEIAAIEKELESSSVDTHAAISKKYLKVVESYLITHSMLMLQYKNLHAFAQEHHEREIVHHKDVTKAQLELMLLDMEYMRTLPALRESIRKINDVLTDSGVLRNETLVMVGVIKDGEIRV